MLSDGRRLHLHDGPIDIILEAFGPAAEIKSAYHAAAKRFVAVLDELCAELVFLRQPAREHSPLPHGPIARKMLSAVQPYAAQAFITTMAAVAGAVAENVLESMTAAADLSRAYVNDGGDIALHLTRHEKFIVGMLDQPDRPSLFGTTTVDAHQPVRGIATSGWRGRSFSLGIADAVTVLADTAAMADAAATIIANAIDLPGHPAIRRISARELAPDSDLGERLVTQAVGALSPDEIFTALSSGARVAESLRTRKLIRAAALNLLGETRLVGGQSGVLPSNEFALERNLVHG